MCEARAQGKLAKSKVWARAAELYGNKYIENCAVPEVDRLFIRAPTSADQIKASFEAMSKNQRAFVTSAQSAGAVAAQTASESADATSDVPPAASNAQNVVSSERNEPEVKEIARSGTQAQAEKRWRQQIQTGRPLTLDDLDGARPIGKKALTQYLRAMGVSVTRAELKSNDGVKERPRLVLRALGVDRWSVSDEGVKRQKCEHVDE